MRCMFFTSGLPLSFLGDEAQYAEYVLNRSPTNADTGKVSPIEILTHVTPALNEIVVFGSPCSV